jgi:hypothetical protein
MAPCFRNSVNSFAATTESLEKRGAHHVPRGNYRQAASIKLDFIGPHNPAPDIDLIIQPAAEGSRALGAVFATNRRDAFRYTGRHEIMSEVPPGWQGGTGYENTVFGQIKDAIGFRLSLLRGLNTVKGACTMLCTAHNLLKIHKAKGQAA